MALYHASIGAWQFSTCSPKPNRQASFRAISYCMNYSFTRRKPIVALSIVGHRPLSASSLCPRPAPIWRRPPAILRYFRRYGGSEEQYQAFEKERERKSEVQIKQLAAQLYTSFHTDIRLKTRRSAKSRRLFPSSNNAQPPEVYLRVAKIIQDFKDTAHMIYISRKLVFGFVVAFYLTWLLFGLEINYNSGNYSQEMPNTKIARWLQSFSKALRPQFLETSDPLTMSEIVGQRPCDWLRSPVSVIPQITTAFACYYSSSLRSSCLIMLALAPLLRQVMSSKRIAFVYIAGGFLASNLEGAVMYFTNPHARLSAPKLQKLLDHIPPSLYDRPLREWLRDSKVDDLHILSQEATVMMAAELEEEFQEAIAKIYEKKMEIKGLNELELLFKYTGQTMGTSSAITCMGTFTHLPN